MKIHGASPIIWFQECRHTLKKTLLLFVMQNNGWMVFIACSRAYISPHSIIFTSSFGRLLPSTGTFSTILTIRSPCFPSSHWAGAQVMKNWHPFVLAPVFAIDNSPAASCRIVRFSSANCRKYLEFWKRTPQSLLYEELFIQKDEAEMKSAKRMSVIESLPFPHILKIHPCHLHAQSHHLAPWNLWSHDEMCILYNRWGRRLS